MRIVKTCLYRSGAINLLPTILITPLYGVVVGWPLVTRPAYTPVPPHWHRAGFRLAFKFACFHAGIEVHYE